MDKLFAVIADPGQLLWRITMSIGVILLGRFLEIVGLSGFCSLCNDFLNSSLGISTGQITLSKHETHHFVELSLRVHHKILKTNEEEGHISKLGIFHELKHPAVDVSDAVLDPPVQVVGIELLKVKRAFLGVIVHADQMEP